MAGMLLVMSIDCAHKKRFHRSPGSSYSPIMPTHNSSSSLPPRSKSYEVYPDEKVGGAAREAKQRLDEKFGAQGKSENKRQKQRRNLFRGLCPKVRSQ